MRNLIRKWWFWVLVAIGIVISIGVIWGPDRAAAIVTGIGVIFFIPAYVLIYLPFEYFGIYDGHANLDHWTDYLTVGLFLIVTLGFWMALGDTIDALRGRDMDEQPTGRVRRFFHHLQIWLPVIRYFRERNRVR